MKRTRLNSKLAFFKKIIPTNPPGFFIVFVALDITTSQYEGFHLPTLEERNTLFSYETDEYFAAKAYKSTIFWEKNPGDDRYSFGAVPAGYAQIIYDVDFSEVEAGQGRLHTIYRNKNAQFWTQDTGFVEMSWKNYEIRRGILGNNYLTSEQFTKITYASVRCLVDKSIEAPPRNPNKY